LRIEAFVAIYQYMKNKLPTLILLPIAAVAILSSGCQAPSQAGMVYSRSEAQTPLTVHYGTVIKAAQVQIQDEETGTGAAIGAIVGGIIGSTIGGGDGKKLATTGGVLAGAAAGSAIEQAGKTKVALEVEVELDDGRLMVIVQELDPNLQLYPGARVRVIESGYGRYRVRN
jgi:outer membrane lipoprotein SlyB